MTVTALSVAAACRAARSAADDLGAATGTARSAALSAFADVLERDAAAILAANAADQLAASEHRLALVRLTPTRLGGAAAEVRRIAAIDDPVGAVLETGPAGGSSRARRIRVPLGLVGLVTDARPRLLPGALATCLRAGNGAIVASSADSARTARALAAAAAEGLSRAGLPAGAVAVVDNDAAALRALGRRGVVDLIKQRGHDAAVTSALRDSEVPVLFAIDGVCHVFVDASADHGLAIGVVLESKLAKPGMCNAVETVLVHAGVAAGLLPALAERLDARGVELRLDERARALVAPRHARWGAATEDDWAAEYAGLVLAIGVVDSLDDALAHIARYGSGHVEAIVTPSADAAERFQRRANAAFVCVNAPTSDGDGRTLGRLADVGNSTQRLPHRGPIGPAELCMTKVVIAGPTPNER
ncbi:MAG TPA: glutamate-5-semialdehyde dehydrogenase [Solirubrobacteraceae bacterium]|jgi:glutamate-5-semialdehyde dehydrogenase|nr:glutamate-5-semialdehyde dehydrogenase [Solirubrobacteraceae bacterium]